MAIVSYGLSNVHYAIVTETVNPSTGDITTSYGAVKKWNGAVSISFNAEGSKDIFYADNRKYYVSATNNGYSGDFVSARVPEDVWTDVYGQTKDADTGLLIEKNTDSTKYIALLFESDTDTDHDRYCFYRCLLSRPNVEAETIEDGKTVKTVSCSIDISPRPDDGEVKSIAKAGDPIYATFYDEVPVA